MVFNRQKPIGNYIIDFYCHKLKLVVEIDGHTHGQPETQIADARRTAYLNQQGLTVIRFTNPEVLNNIDGVMTHLEQVIENQNPKSP
jgi:very-short-patch-repair endonuclease